MLCCHVVLACCVGVLCFRVVLVFCVSALCWCVVFPCCVDQLKRRLKEYGLVTPFSTDAHGHFLSHLLSASHKHRFKRDADEPHNNIFFNITAFGKEFHLRLRPNPGLVAPGAVVEWHDGGDEDLGNVTRRLDSNQSELRRELLKTDCAFIGDITDVPGASVAINNCDGLVSFYVCFPLT
uniref:Peptidase M12B propeptide domain-containing protein n=1 Tax=Knipowitschia caucasica TaxID=637954 RepID=A0AAV2MNW6_KNICA